MNEQNKTQIKVTVTYRVGVSTLFMAAIMRNIMMGIGPLIFVDLFTKGKKEKYSHGISSRLPL
jgi:hypothetical protein